MTQICIVGIGYVGLANALLFCKNNKVIMFDINQKKINLINNKKSPFKDKLICEYLTHKDNNLIATQDKEKAYKNSEYILIAISIDYNEKTNHFDTNLLEETIKDILYFNQKATIIIRSTIPIGFITYIRKKYRKNDIIFCPEFLREGSALYDSLYPNRIIIGDKSEKAKKIANIFKNSVANKNTNILYTNSKEAECIKLFSNAYLAMRVSFFNELDTFSNFYDLNTMEIISGICSDFRIGNYYNNPSFGFGGYCLPKDCKQLLAHFKNIPNSLISSIISSNKKRSDYIITKILQTKSKTIGIYRLIAKSSTDNFRNSIIIEIIRQIKKHRKIIIYEPLINNDLFEDCCVINNLKDFRNSVDLIVANRIDKQIINFKNKIFTRDIFKGDK